jgi:low temperature requirement protein LtrA
MQPRRRTAALPVAGQVTSLELFFDLVFVFTITQLTATVGPGGWAVTGRSALLLLLLWWMYGGYAWLTNAAPPVTARRRSPNPRAPPAPRRRHSCHFSGVATPEK